MKKLFTLFAAAVASLAMFASTVTFDFTDAANFAAWGITAPVASGGFDLDGMSLSKDGVTISFSKGTYITSIRVWNSNGSSELRMYGGNTMTFTVAGADVINAINFGQAVALEGTTEQKAEFTFLEGVQSVTFVGTATVKIKQIIVTLNETVTEWIPDTLSVTEARNLIINKDPLASKPHYIKGVVSNNDFGRVWPSYANIWMNDIVNVNDTLEAYRTYDGESRAKFSEEPDLVIGDTILVFADGLTKYNTIYETTSGYLAEVLGRAPRAPQKDVTINSLTAEHDGEGFDFTIGVSVDGTTSTIWFYSTAPDAEALTGTYSLEGEVMGSITFAAGSTMTIAFVSTGVYSVSIDAVDGEGMKYVGENESVNIAGNFPKDNTSVDVLAAVEVAFATGTTATTTTYTIYGYVAKIKEAYSEQYKNITFYMSDNATATSGEFVAYRAKVADGAQVPVVGDCVKVIGAIVNYQGNTPETNGTTTCEIIDPATIPADIRHGKTPQTIDATVTEALTVGNALEQNASTFDMYHVIGYAIIAYEPDEKGEQTFYIAEAPIAGATATDAEKNNSLMVQFTVPDATVAVGDQIEIVGKITHYYRTATSGTSEYICIRNGVAKHSSRFYLSLIPENVLQGSVSASGYYGDKSNVTISATPNNGYHFTQWSDGNTDNPRTVVVTSDTTFTAEFAKNQYIISTSVQSGNGTTYGDSIAEYQDQIQISAVADYGWQFSRWNDGNGSNPRTIVATEDKEYKAIFVRKNFYVSVLSANTTMGYVNGGGNYEYESNATISATGRLGYEFNEWSDGNAENPRTFVVTGDTTFTATFRMQTQGECGNDLRWEYRNNVLYISGTGAMANYSTSTQPWYLYRDSIQTLVLNAGITSIGNYAFYGLSKITKLTLPEGLTTIGAYAFSGCNHITEIIFSSTISSIGDYAFYNCTRVLDMTSYATVTPDVATNALTSISSYAYLYVQAGYKRVYLIDNNWSRFVLMEIGAETVTTPVEDVVVEPSENEAEFTWPTSTEAASYSLTITKDGIVFCTLTFNANGQLTGLAFAPGRNGAEHALAATTSVAGMTFTVTGLDAATAYAFSFDAKDASQQVIESYTGTFETAGYQAPDTPTEVEHMDGVNKYVNTPTKLLHDGQVFIQRGDRLFDLRGQELR